MNCPFIVDSIGAPSITHSAHVRNVKYPPPIRPTGSTQISCHRTQIVGVTWQEIARF